MGSSSETYKNLQVIPVMDSYKDLDKTLLLYDGQQISKGMPAVFEARKHTMLTLRGLFPPPLMHAWGFDTSATATFKKADKALVLKYLQTNVDSKIASVNSTSIGFPTILNLSDLYLQENYSAYNLTTRQFMYTDGGCGDPNDTKEHLYKYGYSVDSGGGNIDIICYRVIYQLEVDTFLAAKYDSVTNVSYADTPVENGGNYAYKINFTYTKYHVTITTTTDNGTAKTKDISEKDLTILGDIKAGTVTSSSSKDITNDNGTPDDTSDDTTTTITTTTTVTTTIDKSQIATTAYMPVTYVTFTTTDNSYNFITDLIDKYGGTTTGLTVDGWYKTPALRAVEYGIGPIPYSSKWRSQDYSCTYAQFTYDIDRVITRVNGTEINVKCTASNIGISTDLNTHNTSVKHFNNASVINFDDASIASVKGLIESYEEEKLYNNIDHELEVNNSNIITTYTLNNNEYIYVIPNSDTSNLIINIKENTLPIFSLKKGGILNDNPNTGLALRNLGMTGDEFDESIKDSKIKYSSLGFMFDPTDNSMYTVILMYETFRHLSSTGVLDTAAKGAWGFGIPITVNSGSGFSISYQGLTIHVSAKVTVNTKYGNIGDAETYNPFNPTGTTGKVGDYNFASTTYQEEIPNPDIGHKGAHSRTITVNKIRRIYRKQETSDYYVEVIIDDLHVNHKYNGVSSTIINSSSVYNDGSKIGRLPILREITHKLPFNMYVQALQMSLTLVVYSEVTVKTKWYQSGLFQFVLLVAAIVVTIVTAGAAAPTVGAVLGMSAATATMVAGVLADVALVGLVATDILLAANFVGADLGVFGEVLQVVAIIGAVAGLANMSLTALAEKVTTTTASGASIAANAENTCIASANEALANGDQFMANAYMNLAQEWGEMASEYGMTSMGQVVEDSISMTTPVMSATSSITSELEATLSTNNVLSVSTEAPSTFENTLSTAHTVFGYTSKVTKIIKGVQDIINEHKLNKLKQAYEDLSTMQEAAKKEIEALQDMQGTALMLAPNDMLTMFDRVTTIPDPLKGMDDPFTSLMDGVTTNYDRMLYT